MKTKKKKKKNEIYYLYNVVKSLNKIMERTSRDVNISFLFIMNQDET